MYIKFDPRMHLLTVSGIDKTNPQMLKRRMAKKLFV